MTMSKNAAVSNRIGWIDIAKGIGILLVIIGHLLPAESKLRLFIYTFHMPLFFALSGVVYSGATSAKKLDKLTVVYLLYSFVFLVADIFLRVFLLGEYEVTAIVWEVYQTVTLYGINVLWFLSTLILCKAFCHFLIANTNKIVSLLIGVGLYFLTSTVARIYSMETESVSIIRLAIYFPVSAILRAFSVMIYFLLGYSCKALILRVSTACNKIVLFAAGALLAVVLFLTCEICGNVDVHMMQTDNMLISLLFGVLGSCAVCLLCPILEQYTVSRKFLVFCGRHSVLFMVLHEYLFVSLVCEQLLKAIGCFYVVPHVIITIALTSLLVRITYTYFDRFIDYITAFIMRIATRGK